MAKTHSAAQKMHLLEPTAQIWMKIDPYYQRQKCRPMNLVSENIRFMRIFAGVPLGAGVKRHWGLSTTAIFGDLGGYVFENFTDTASNNMLPLVDRQMIANWMTLNHLESQLSGSFMTKCVFGQHFLNQSVWMSEIVQPLRFSGVLCIARLVSQPMLTCTADALFLCGSWASSYSSRAALASLLVCYTKTCIN